MSNSLIINLSDTHIITFGAVLNFPYRSAPVDIVAIRNNRPRCTPARGFFIAPAGKGCCFSGMFPGYRL